MHSGQSEQPRVSAYSGLKPKLEPGHVYRAQEFEQATLEELCREGRLAPLGRGLYGCLKQSRFGPVPPTEEALVRALLGDQPFVFTGPDYWNALGLGSTAVFARSLVYNTVQSGLVELDGRVFEFRKVSALPKESSKEWLAVNLLENAAQASVSAADVAAALRKRVRRGEYDRSSLRETARRYATPKTAELVESALN
jgi:hypothetical protein